jgi:hypothetical protein
MIGGAALAIWLAVEPAAEADFNEWYARQHMPERLSVPGFLRGRRYAASGGSLPYFTLYEVDGAAVLSSAPYLERLNTPTEWTRRVLPRWPRMIRNAYGRVAATGDDLVANHLLTVQIKPHSGRGPAIRSWMESDGTATLGQLPGARDGGLYVSDTGGTTIMTEERRLVRADVLPATPFLALCEIVDPAQETALREFWAAWARKLAADVTVDLYRFLYGLGWINPA